VQNVVLQIHHISTTPTVFSIIWDSSHFVYRVTSPDQADLYEVTSLTSNTYVPCSSFPDQNQLQSVKPPAQHSDAISNIFIALKCARYLITANEK